MYIICDDRTPTAPIGRPLQAFTRAKRPPVERPAFDLAIVFVIILSAVFAMVFAVNYRFPVVPQITKETGPGPGPTEQRARETWHGKVRKAGTVG